LRGAVLLLLFLSLSFGAGPVEYELLKRFKETKDTSIALFLLENYPQAVFSDELRVELAGLLLERGEMDLAKRIAGRINLREVRDEYGGQVLRLWTKLKLDPKPLLLRFPELSVHLLGKVSLKPEEEEKVFNRLLREGRFEEVLTFSKSCLLRGIALYRLKRYKESIEELKVCPEKRSKIYVLLSYLKLKDLEGAEEFVKMEGDNELYFRLGFTFLTLGEYPKARRLFLDSGPDARGLFYAGLTDFAMGNYLLAYESFSEAEKFTQDKAQKARIYFWKAKALSELGFPNLSTHYLKLASEMEGFYSVVARKYLGKRIQKEVSLQNLKSGGGMVERLIAIKELGFTHYMRLEAFRGASELTPGDLLRLLDVEPSLAIRIAARTFGTDSEVYRAVAFPTPFLDIVDRVSKRFGVDKALIYAVMRQESLFDGTALSTSKAKGLMQLIDSTAKWKAKRLGMNSYDIYDTETNITLGTAYLRYLLDLWDGDIVKVIASYNAGQGAVKGWKDYADHFLFIETIPYEETRDYVKKVLTYLYIYSEKLSK